MTTTPTIPSAQAPAVAQPLGTLSREWFVFLTALLAVVVDHERRIAALEAK